MASSSPSPSPSSPLDLGSSDPSLLLPRLWTDASAFLATVDELLLARAPLDAALAGCLPDHICLRTQSPEEHRALRTLLLDARATLLSELAVKGRPIALFHLPLALALTHADRAVIDVLELPAPKPASPYPSGWEHIEVPIASEDDVQDAMDESLDWLCATSRERLASWLARWAQPLRDAGFLVNDASLSANGHDNSSSFNHEVKISRPDAAPGLCVKVHWLPLAAVVDLETKHGIMECK